MSEINQISPMTNGDKKNVESINELSSTTKIENSSMLSESVVPISTKKNDGHKKSSIHTIKDYHHPNSKQQIHHRHNTRIKIEHDNRHHHHEDDTYLHKSLTLNHSVKVNGKLPLIKSKSKMVPVPMTIAPHKNEKDTNVISISSRMPSMTLSPPTSTNADTKTITKEVTKTITGDDTKNDQIIISKYGLEEALNFVHDTECLDHFSIAKKFKCASEKLNSEEKNQVQQFIISKKDVFDEHKLEKVYQRCLDLYFK